MSQENVEIVRRSYDAWNSGDFEVAVADLAPDLEFVPVSGSLVGGADAHRGPEGFLGFLERFSAEFDDVRVEAHEFIDAEDQVLVPVTWSARGKQSGAEVTWSVVTAYTLHNGRVTRVQNFTTRAEALEAVGLSE